MSLKHLAATIATHAAALDNSNQPVSQKEPSQIGMVRSRWRTAFNLLIFAAWIAIVSYQIYYHVMWRDEVRALSFALDGKNIIEMIKGLHGEGHPIIWYLLLRVAHSIVGTVEVMPGVSMLIATSAAALLIFRSPFPLLLVVGILFSRFLFFEYSVMARNYGISVLLLFLIAHLYERKHCRGVTIGGLLFLLANTNVVAALMVGAFFLFWFFDIIERTGLRLSRELNVFAMNAGIGAVGILICGLTLFPLNHSIYDWSHYSPLARALMALLHPAGASALSSLWIGEPIDLKSMIAASAVLFLLPLGLLPRRAAFLSAICALFVTALLFSLGPAGLYRHGGILFFFWISLYWITWRDVVRSFSDKNAGFLIKTFTAFGLAGLVVLVSVQVFKNKNDFMLTLANPEDPPLSRSAELGRLIASRPELAKATIFSDIDFNVETLPYYMSNRTYLIYQNSFGNKVSLLKTSGRKRTLGDFLRVSRELKMSTGEPVIILMTRKLDQLVPGQLYQMYGWSFTATAEEIEAFKKETKLLAQFGLSRTEENYDVYLF